MDADFGGLVAAFEGRHVAVIGDAMLDSYLRGSADRLCREAPVPVIDVSDREEAPGGAANTAVNLRALRAEVLLLSAVGQDPDGDALMEQLTARGVDTRWVLRDPARRTLAKQRIFAYGQLIARVDHGTGLPLPPWQEAALIEAIGALAPGLDALVVSDYAYGVLTPALIAELARRRAALPVLVVDARDLSLYRALRPTAVKPNYAEACRLLGVPEAAAGRGRAALIEERGALLLDRTGARIVAATLDAEGALVFEAGGEPHRIFARADASAGAAGAGDTFVAALTLALAAGAGATAAAEVASAAASVVMGKPGTGACDALALRARLAGDDKLAGDASSVLHAIEARRASGERVVFTNGCFDLLHRGHVSCLARAKELGDVLVVGVNSDASTARLKGPGRPLNALEDRMRVLAALSCVDYVLPFEDDTPAALISAIRPHVYAKGGDYELDALPEAPLVRALGGEVHIIPYLEDRSTTRIIERARGSRGAAGPALAVGDAA